MTNDAENTAAIRERTITSVQAESTLEVVSSASEYNLPQSAEEQTVVINSKISVLLCGDAKLDSVGIVGKLHVTEQLGRRKLKSKDFEAEAYVDKADVLWLTPKRHWTVDKTEHSLQDQTLKLAECFLQSGKDVVIVTDKDFRFKRNGPSETLHRYETPGHIVLCSVKLPELHKSCGTNKDEQCLNIAIAGGLLCPDRVGVRQSNSKHTGKATMQPSYHTKSQSSVKTAPDVARKKTDKQKVKQVASEVADNRQLKKQVKFATDEYDLGDHADNNDKATPKPNYAAENAREKKKAKATSEPSKDDCGDDMSAIELPDDSSSFVVFVESENSPCNLDTGTKTSHAVIVDQNQKAQKVYLSGMDELFLFLEVHEKEQAALVFPAAKIPSQHYFKHDHTRMHVMEVYGGHGGVTRIAIRRGLTCGKNFDLAVGVDLLKPGESQKLLKYVDQYQPMVTVMGPPCTAFGSWARYNKIHAHEAWSRSLAIGVPLAKLCAEIAEKQRRAGRYYLIENPWSSELWELPCFQHLMKFSYVAYCEQCMLGLTDMDGIPSLKPTAFISNAEELVKPLDIACEGRHSYHSPLAGTLHGVSKTSYAQRWPELLCKTIVRAIEKLCCSSKYLSTTHLKQAYAGDVVEPAINTFKCTGCRSHAYRKDPRHSRVRGECRFPNDVADVLKCPACLRNLPSHHPRHSHAVGECHWAEAIPRMEGGSSSSRGPRPMGNVRPDVELNASPAARPPPCKLGTWSRTYDSYLLDILNALADQDGWHELADGAKALVMTNTRFTREPEPRYKKEEYTLRSTYGRFTEHPHDAGAWWQIEEGEPYHGKERHMGYPVECLIHIFETGVPGVSPTENKIPDGASSSDLPQNAIDETRRTVQRPARRKQDEATREMPIEVEHGESEPEVPEISEKQQLQSIEAKEEEQALAKIEEDQALAKAEQIDWSAVDLGTALRELKSENKALVTRALRKLHLRWYHAPPTRMKTILSKVGIQNDTLQLVQSVCDSCRICRAWKKPSSKSMTHLQQAEEFNHRVQCDLLFIGDYIIMHCCDEATRFSVAEVIKSKEPEEILGALKRAWIRYFGAPQLFISDSEGALGSEEAGIWAERLGTSFKLLPRYSHATIVERHHETLRQVIHKIMAQAKAERIMVNMEDIVAEATIAKNSLLTINGYTPYTAVLGRNPTLLGEYERPTVSAVADTAGGNLSKHATRLREIAVASMVETSAKERIQRAQVAQTRIATEQLELNPNDLVDIYRTPRTKDNIGWRGPCKVVSVEDGQVNVQWNGRVICCRVQDVRKAMMYPSMLLERSDDAAMEVVRKYATSLVNTIETFGMVQTPKGWELSQAARRLPNVFHALLRIAHDMFSFQRCVAARVGHGKLSTNGFIGAVHSVLVWWPDNNPQLYKSMSCSAASDLNLKQLFGDTWNECSWIRFFGASAVDADQIRQLAPDVPYLGDRPNPDDRPDPPANPIPMEEDDDEDQDTSMYDNQSLATTRIAMDTDHGPPPPPPGAPGASRQPQNSARSRTTRGQATPVSTNRTLSSVLTPNTATATQSTDRSQRATTGTSTPPELKSPRGEKRTPVRSTNSTADTTRTHKRHQTQASGSQDPAPTPVTQTHEPLLPIIDDYDDDPDLNEDRDEEDLETVAQSEPDVSALHVQTKDFCFATDVKTYLQIRSEKPIEESWDTMFASGRPPFMLHWWELHPGFEDVVENQAHYLAHSTEYKSHHAMRSSSTEQDCCEIEFGPNMSIWLVKAPKLEVDEILVFKSTSAVSSAQIEKNYDALTPQEIKEHHVIVEAAIRKDCPNVCTAR